MRGVEVVVDETASGELEPLFEAVELAPQLATHEQGCSLPSARTSPARMILRVC
jgi:hypothetical protein